MKEYMEKLINENSVELQQLQNRISYLLIELEKQNERIEKIQRNSARDENIFSPRSVNILNEESIMIEKNKRDSIKQEIDYVSAKIEKLFEKQKEYEKVLCEIDSKSENVIEDNNIEERKLINITTDIKECIDTIVINNTSDKVNDNKEENNTNSNIKSNVNNNINDNINDNINSKSNNEINSNINNNNIINNDENRVKDLENSLYVCSHKQLDEIPENNQMKLAETLSEVLKSMDIALALLNGDKNKCKNELKKIKRTLKMCIEEIK